MKRTLLENRTIRGCHLTLDQTFFGVGRRTDIGRKKICYKIDHNKSALLAFSQLRVAAWSDTAWETHSATADSGIRSPVYSRRLRCLRNLSSRMRVCESTPRVVGNV
jgi:hypothetical protein